MAACNFNKLKGICQRIFIIGLPVLLLVQLLVSLTVTRSSTSGDEPAFLVISIEKKNEGSLSDLRKQKRGLDSGVLGLWTAEDSRLTGYEDENELEGQATARELILQPWASEQPSLFAELQRLTRFITTIEVNCSVVQGSDWSQLSLSSGYSDVFCINHWRGKKGCVAYSFSLDGKDAAFLDTMLHAECEVHRFDPSRRVGREPASIKHHRVWLDWRNPRGHSHTGLMGNIQRRLLDIMDSLGHITVDVLCMDLESAEWRMLESWIKDGTLNRINQLILTIHLQWAGFEVGGAEEEVVRFWYSVLRAIRISGLRLVYSAHGPGHTVLRHTQADSHSTYTLSWIRTRGQSR
ncbi:probable methyltransferase-like protein 24 [Danio rerio]|uniref:Methyltransferase-like protein 24 n=1 Tax=Danio rerio TaxID=7955 RepID=A0A0G2KU24_DANRE|nr:methyltransferase-like protein 24 [Danio rerio]|eukprot:XP_005159833.1 methyltransferase-like protein 24 [Danio rerio]